MNELNSRVHQGKIELTVRKPSEWELIEDYRLKGEQSKFFLTQITTSVLALSEFFRRL